MNTADARNFQVMAEEGIRYEYFVLMEDGKAAHVETYTLEHGQVLNAYAHVRTVSGHVTSWRIHGPFVGEFFLSDLALDLLMGDHLREI